MITNDLSLQCKLSHPLVSVVIPCFNAAATIDETLESVFRQTMRDFEIIAVDDGSRDETCAIIERFGKDVQLLRGPNGGASKARNRGTAAAQGTFIQYLDADDLLAPNALQERVALLEAAGADIAYSDYQYFEEEKDGVRQFGRVVAKSIADVDPDPQIAAATTFWAPPAALLYRRRIVDAVGKWNESLPMIEDARFLFDAIRAGARLVHAPGVSALYRVTAGSLSRCDKPEYVRCVYRNGCDIQAAWEADGPLTVARRAALSSVFRGAAYEFLKLDLPEFSDALARYQAISSERLDFLAMAGWLSPYLGRPASLSVLQRASDARSRLRGVPAAMPI